MRESDEVGVVPNVTVGIGGKTGVSLPATGRVELDGVTGGADPVSVTSMPPFYQTGTPVTLNVPQVAGVEVYVPLVLPIGNNTPSLYMGFGDSITEGDGSSDNMGYRSLLARMLVTNLNQGSINNQGIGGTRSNDGAERIRQSLTVAPAYALIMYGTNDWNDIECRESFPCYTIDSLRTIIRAAKAQETLPVISSILPCNTGYDGRTPPERNVWVADMDGLIKTMAAEEGAVYVDAFSAFMAVPGGVTTDGQGSLFSDHVHPNDQGYQLLAKLWFAAITTPAATSQSLEAAPVIPKGRNYGNPDRVIGRYEE